MKSSYFINTFTFDDRDPEVAMSPFTPMGKFLGTLTDGLGFNKIVSSAYYIHEEESLNIRGFDVLLGCFSTLKRINVSLEKVKAFLGRKLVLTFQKDREIYGGRNEK